MDNATDIKYSNADIARVAEEHELDEEAFAIYCYNFHITKDYEDEVDNFQDAYIGDIPLDDYAYDLIREVYTIPAELEPYIDHTAFARDLTYGGDVWEMDGHLFRGQ